MHPNQFKKNYKDKPPSSREKLGELLGISVLVLVIGAFLYLIITGIPGIQTTFIVFVQTIANLFSLDS